MDIEKIRALRRATPFRPFKLVLQSGRQLLVDHPFFLGIEPDGSHLIWSSFSGGFQRVNPARVNQVVMVERRKTGSDDNGNRGAA